jgi:hypothetical protein
MEHLILFENYSLNENRINLNIGDVVSMTTSPKKFLVLSNYQLKLGNKFPLKFTAINLDDLAKLKKGDKKGRVIYTIQIKPENFKVIDKGDQKDVDLANDVHTEIHQSHAAAADKNYEKIAYDQTKRAFGVEMVDGNKAFMGDSVIVKFSNGNFKGMIKQIAGNQTGEVIIVFPGKTKGRGIKPINILKKA